MREYTVSKTVYISNNDIKAIKRILKGRMAKVTEEELCEMNYIELTFKALSNAHMANIEKAIAQYM